jgi:putative component of membrane protein insertase Oxa1/YidC/SpoIIIJ protein YidD
MLALASGKLVFGLVFYTLFFSPARSYAAIQIPHLSPYDASALKKWSRLAAGAFATALLTLLATRLTDWIENLLKR